MFHVKYHKQLNIFDPWAYLGPKRRKLLDDSCAGLFQQKILPKIPGYLNTPRRTHWWIEKRHVMFIYKVCHSHLTINKLNRGANLVWNYQKNTVNNDIL
jgi:hypothetical protein